ncbi:MAG: hypothetical protein KF898_05125 [Parachlamydiales bacterium]|nr:hypothetical protein [Verrucomicrobiota bacterium]MBX3719010.1 hypothetical protein [Candidatus Acheromyda pituitae]
MKLFNLLVILFAVLFSSHCLARGTDFQNYVYDDQGNPLFVKVYVPASKMELWKSSDKINLLSAEGQKIQILRRIVQEDGRGGFLVVPIKKKRSKDDDDEESTWECPYCLTVNPSNRHACSNPECPLYRKGGRDW